MLYSLETIQKLPVSVEEAWDFLSSPANLTTITPAHMGFNILSGFTPGIKMYPGMIVEYTVKPFLGIPLHWVTEITHVEYLQYFVDEQRFGPYAFWHHAHFIKPIEGGVEMKDVIHYKLPLAFVGRIANKMFVKKQLQEIFDFRQKKLTEIFGRL